MILVLAVVVIFAVVLGFKRTGTDRPLWPASLGLVALALFGLLATRGAGGGEEEVDTKVFFTQPLDGASVRAPVQVAMGAEGLVVEPAGPVREGAGHFHVVVDAPCVEAGKVVPADATHHHLGKGQTDATLDLEAGEHTLCLQAGDGAHTAFGATDRITLVVAG